jgi:hypothetical protein
VAIKSVDGFGCFNMEAPIKQKKLRKNLEAMHFAIFRVFSSKKKFP